MDALQSCSPRFAAEEGKDCASELKRKSIWTSFNSKSVKLSSVSISVEDAAVEIPDSVEISTLAVIGKFLDSSIFELKIDRTDGWSVNLHSFAQGKVISLSRSRGEFPVFLPQRHRDRRA